MQKHFIKKRLFYLKTSFQTNIKGKYYYIGKQKSLIEEIFQDGNFTINHFGQQNYRELQIYTKKKRN